MEAPEAAKLYNKDSIQDEDMKTLLSTGTPTFGDYRDPCYSALVHKAADHIYQRIVLTKETDRHRVAHASCCQAWGERRKLEDKGHPARHLKDIGLKKELKIASKYELLRHIIGDEPQNKNTPWMVQFPRVAVDCGSIAPRLYSFVVMVAFCSPSPRM